MMQFAAQAAKHLAAAEIVELHHDRKLDAPSGTALRTAEMMRHVEGSQLAGDPQKIADNPARGLAAGSIPVGCTR